MLKQYVQFQVFKTQMNKKQKGQSMVEYGLILALIAMACVIALTNLGGGISTMMGDLQASVEGIDTAAR